MSGQQIGTVVGGAIGAYLGAGNPAAIQLGMAIGGAIGGAVDPTHINGPKIGDGQQQAATDGNPIAWIQGTAMVAGTIVQVSKRRQIRHKDDGKGSGTVQVTYTAQQDFAILICESCSLRDSTMSAVLVVIQDGKIVYDVRTGSTMIEASFKWKANVDFMLGGEDQLPHPTLEAITGVGNTPAYRGSLVAVFKNFDVSTPGDRIPNFQFVVASESTSSSSETTTIATGGVVTGGAPTVQLFSAAFSPPTIPYPPFVLFKVDPPTSERPANAPRRAVVLDNLGRTAWDSGWVGDSSYQDALNAAIAGSAYPTLTGVLSGTTSVTSLAVLVGAGVTGYTLDMYVGATGDTGGLGLSAICRITTVPTLPDTAGESVPLPTIIARICKRGGLSPSDFDASKLAGVEVAGYPIARQANAADCLLPLLQSYFAYGSEFESKLNFDFYGNDALVTIDANDLLENTSSDEGDVTSNLRNQATEFPRRVVASYMDPAQNFSVVNVAAERRSIDVTAIGDQAFQIPVVMSADDAAKAADKALKVAYATLQGKLGFSTPFAGSDSYIMVAAGEPIIFRGKRYVADEMVLGNGSIKFTPRYDRQSAYTSNVQAIVGNAPSVPISIYSGPTVLVPMNLPSQRPQDTVGIYVTAAGALGQDSWRGCVVQVSYDGQASWVNALTIPMEATIGSVALDEPTGGEPITVNSLKYPLESVTPAQLAVKANGCCTVNAAGDAQLWQFGTATETATDLQFELTDTSRSLAGTTAYPVSVGDAFTLMDAAYFLPIDQSFQGKTLYLRGVGYGENAEDATIYSLVYLALVQATGQSITSESGVDLTAEDDFNILYTEQ